MFTFFSGPHVGRPTVGTKSFDSASNSILSDGPTGYMTNRSSCSINLTKQELCNSRRFIAVRLYDALAQVYDHDIDSPRQIKLP